MNAQTTVDLILATFLIVPIQVILLHLGLYTIQDPSNPAIFNPQNGIWFFVGYGFLTIIYCIATSLLFNPKRIVSPLNIQIASWIAIVLIEFSFDYNRYGTLMFSLPVTLNSTTTTIFYERLLIVSFLAAILLFVGMCQLLLVRSVVGPNLIGVNRNRRGRILGQ